MTAAPTSRRRATGFLLGLALTVAACSAAEPAERGPSEPPPSTSATAGPQPSEGPGVLWATDLDSRPTLAVVGPDGVYVTTSGTGKFSPQVYRLGAEDGRELAHRTSAGQPNDVLLAPDGDLWIAAERHSDQPVGTGINIYDPATLLVVDEVALPGSPLSLARVADQVWVGSREAVFVVDPTTYEVVSTFPLAGPAYQLLPTSDGDHVVVVEGAALEVLSVRGDPVARVPVAADGNVIAVLSAGSVWARVPVGADAELRRYELPGLAELPAGPALDSVSGGLLAAGEAVWALDDRADDLVCVAPDGAVSAQPVDDAVGSLGVLAADQGADLLLATDRGLQARRVGCSTPG